jgi:hypothetical protein
MSMKSALAVAALLLALIGPVACDKGPRNYSCTQTISMNGLTYTKFCSEYSGLTSDQVELVKTQCTLQRDGSIQTSGVLAEGPCSSVGIIGGCRLSSGSYQSTSWYYEGGSMAPKDVQQMCGFMGAAYVPVEGAPFDGGIADKYIAKKKEMSTNN